jgi:hypothetical protein
VIGSSTSATSSPLQPCSLGALVSALGRIHTNDIRGFSNIGILEQLSSNVVPESFADLSEAAYVIIMLTDISIGHVLMIHSGRSASHECRHQIRIACSGRYKLTILAEEVWLSLE